MIRGAFAPPFLFSCEVNLQEFGRKEYSIYLKKGKISI